MEAPKPKHNMKCSARRQMRVRSARLRTGQYPISTAEARSYRLGRELTKDVCESLPRWAPSMAPKPKHTCGMAGSNHPPSIPHL